MNKIDKKIVGYKIVKQEETSPEKIEEPIKVVRALTRQQQLSGKTWKLRPPYAEHTLYVTINSIEQEGKKLPFEIFFNTKDLHDIELLNGYTLLISNKFRDSIQYGVPLQPMIANLKETIGTRGSYLSKVPSKPKFVNGLVAEIGYVIEEFNNECLVYNYSESSHEFKPTTEEQEAALAYEYEALEQALDSTKETKVTNPCPICSEQLVIMDGCPTCTACGFSKCG